jgi:hypothetical protein
VGEGLRWRLATENFVAGSGKKSAEFGPLFIASRDQSRLTEALVVAGIMSRSAFSAT